MTDAQNPGSRPTGKYQSGSIAGSNSNSNHNSEASAEDDIAEDPRIVEVVHEYLTRLERGEVPDRAAYIQRYPDLAEVVEHCLEGLEMVQAGLKSSYRLAKDVFFVADAGLGYNAIRQGLQITAAFAGGGHG